MQGVGIVASVGNSVNHIKVGTPVAFMTFGSYAEFSLVLRFMSICYTLNYLLAHVLLEMKIPSLLNSVCQ